VASRRLAAAALAALTLTGCSAGVPPTGKVVTVTGIPPPAPVEQVAAAGSGPRPGSTETEIAQGYMFAMNSGDKDVVARWVAPGRARQQVERWSSQTPVNVYDTFEPTLPSEVNGRRIVAVQVKRIGRLEHGRDWTPDAQPQTIDLELRKVGSDWRVANPGELWLDDDNFRRLHGPVDMFMVAADRQHLAPVSVFVPRPPQGSNPLAALEQRAEAALRGLLEGPQGRVSALETAIPPGTRLRDFSYRNGNGVATVDLTAPFAAPTGLDGRLRVGQIVWTVTRLIQTAQVRILVDGSPVGQIGPDRFQVARDRPWQRTTPPLGSLWPQRSSASGADKVLFVRKGEVWAVRPEPNQAASLLAFGAPGLKSAPTWAPNHRRIAFLLSNGSQQSVWVGEPGGQQAAPTGLRARRLSPPSWSPDSNRLYVLSRDGGRIRLNLVDLVNWSVDPLALAPLPGDLQPTLLEVSPDGAFVLAVGAGRDAQPGDGGQLFLGLLGPQGVTSWFPRPITPGLGTVFSPVWVDALTVAFIAQTNAKDDYGKLWIMKSDGWDPTPVLNVDPDSESPIDIGNQLTVDPEGTNFIFTVRSEDGTSLWMVDREGNLLRSLTTPQPNDFATDPSFASR
jgi:Sporulation and spore germination